MTHAGDVLKLGVDVVEAGSSAHACVVLHIALSGVRGPHGRRGPGSGDGGAGHTLVAGDLAPGAFLAAQAALAAAAEPLDPPATSAAAARGSFGAAGSNLADRRTSGAAGGASLDLAAAAAAAAAAVTGPPAVLAAVLAEARMVPTPHVRAQGEAALVAELERARAAELEHTAEAARLCVRARRVAPMRGDGLSRPHSFFFFFFF